MRTGVRGDDAAQAGSALQQQLVSMSSLPPPLLPLAELLGDSAEVRCSVHRSHIEAQKTTLP